ncbi:MAG: hypothetical protein FD159_2328 [Syntrophaceae bacterium]|nr:MAG: hypothetical protein FD159_2328 [Syntrophaceae bacterium]
MTGEMNKIDAIKIIIILKYLDQSKKIVSQDSALVRIKIW